MLIDAVVLRVCSLYHNIVLPRSYVPSWPTARKRSDLIRKIKYALKILVPTLFSSLKIYFDPNLPHSTMHKPKIKTPATRHLEFLSSDRKMSSHMQSPSCPPHLLQAHLLHPTSCAIFFKAKTPEQSAPLSSLTLLLLQTLHTSLQT